MKKANLLIGNAENTLWDSSEINEGNESLFDFISTNLSMCNKRKTATFPFPSSENFDSCREVLDIALLTDNGTFRIKNWRVSD